MSKKPNCEARLTGAARVNKTLANAGAVKGGLSELLRSGSVEEKSRFFKAVIAGANASQRDVVEKAKTMCSA